MVGLVSVVVSFKLLKLEATKVNALVVIFMDLTVIFSTNCVKTLTIFYVFKIVKIYF